jgi:hypothetical protein
VLGAHRCTGRAPSWAVWLLEQCTVSSSEPGKGKTRPARMTSDHLFSTYIIKPSLYKISCIR